MLQYRGKEAEKMQRILRHDKTGFLECGINQKVIYCVHIMGCQELTYKKNDFLEVVHRKNGQTQKKNALDYFSFGMPMPNRNVEGQYRYAYQGQEKDDETGKEAFELRLWDARIGRWLTTDPYRQYSSPYLGMGNNPISRIDPDGGSDCPNPPCNQGESTEFNFLSGEYELDLSDGFSLDAVDLGKVFSTKGTTLIVQSMVDFVRLEAKDEFTSVEIKIPDNNSLRDRDKVSQRSRRESMGFNRTFSNISFDENYNVLNTGIKDNSFTLYYTTGNTIRSSNWDSPYTGKPEPLGIIDNSKIAGHEGAIFFSSNPKTTTNGVVGAITFKNMNDKHKFIKYFENIRNKN